MTSRILGVPRLHPRFFGRGRRFNLDGPAVASRLISDDARLFATTFAGGLLFMTVYLG